MRRRPRDDALTLNFRGADVRAIAEDLASRGHQFESPPKGSDDKGWSATVRDPDGYPLFFDTAAGETKKT